MNTLDVLEEKIDDPRLDAEQLRHFAQQALHQLSTLRQRYIELDKSMGVAFTEHVVEGATLAREELATASTTDAIRAIARRVLTDARSVEQMLRDYY